jgi:hypothetical protein
MRPQPSEPPATIRAAWRKRSMRVLAVWIVALSFATAAANSAEEEIVKYEANPSLITLIADPGRFEGKLVYTTGVARVEHEGFRIYLTQQDAEHRVVENSVRFDPTNSAVDLARMKKLSGEYVQIGGKVVTRPHSDESGARVVVITEISMFREL